MIPQRHAQAIKAMLARHHLYASKDHLRECLLAQYPDQGRNGEFPGGELNQRRVTAVAEATRSIEAATGHPELRTIAPLQRMDSLRK